MRPLTEKISNVFVYYSQAIIHSDAAFSPGSGPIWIDSIQCKGIETNLKHCISAVWSPSYKCKHFEDVSIECIPRMFYRQVYLIIGLFNIF